MSKTLWTRAGVAVAAGAVMIGAAGCQGGDTAADKAAKPSKPAGAQWGGTPAQAITAAYEKVAEAKSSKVRMTMSIPGAAGAGGAMELSGVQGWDPSVMDVTMKGGELAADPEAPESIRVIMVDNVMYMDMGAKAAADMGGKRWMKLDLAAAAKASGDPSAEAALQQTGGLENINQDPAQQLALLLDSPNLKHVGPEKVEGVDSQHYKGTLTFKEMLDANKSLDVLGGKDREALVENVEKAGIKGYDMDVWVNKDGYPTRMKVGIDSKAGKITMDAYYSDYGATADVQPPAEKDVFDLAKMLEGIGDVTESLENDEVPTEEEMAELEELLGEDATATS
ncbi:hypothetical protein [Streptomyces sp. NPDC060194]|uniref:hypothetical protein n=1 Tax=Streptomyces sp. NPDC060194 TaxID=3347069 RepID=UPI003649A3C8